MKINVKQKNDSLVEFSVTLKWKDIEKDYFEEQNKILSETKQKGARKGKLVGIQRELFIKNNKDYINSSFVDNGLNLYYRQALEQKKMIPINQGKVSKLEFDGESSDFSFVIEFEIRPSIDKKIPNYEKKVTLKTNRYIATDKDVDRAIEDLRVKHATMKSLDEKSKLKSGHFIYADFTKLDDSGASVEGGVLPNHHIKIGEGLFVGDLEKPFLNKKIGDIVKITVKQENVDVDYNVKINKIEEQILPKVDKKFAEKVDEKIKTVKELRDKFKNNIQSNLDNEHKKEFHNQIVEYFIDKTKFDPPQSMVDNYRSYLVEDYKSKNPDSFDEEKMSKDLDNVSNKNIKWLLIREFLVEKEKISLSSKEVEDKIKDFIKETPNYKKDIIKFYSEENNKNKLREDLLSQKFFNKFDNFFINKVKEIKTDKIKQKKG
tara:strand:- start:2467 stop:3762 length:1296 start_codon:yes stop_codon:yes gene_type:complete